MNKLGKIIERILKIKHIEYLILTTLLIFGLLVRLYKIDNPIADWHSWRQADTASVTRSYVERGVNLFFPRYHDISTIQTGFFNPEGYRFVEFPLYNAIHTILARHYPFLSLEVWGRLLSIFSSLAAAYCLFYLGKRYINVWGGVLTTFFFLFIPFNIYFSRVILPEPMSVTLGLFALVLFVSFIDTGRFWKLFVSGVLLSLGILVKPFIVFYTVPMIYLLLEKYGVKSIFRNARVLIPLLIFVDIILVPFILWRAWINQYPQGIPFFWWAFNGDGIRYKPSFWKWIFGERLGHLILGSWGIVPFAFGLLSKTKSLFSHSFLFGMFLYVSIIATANVRHDYYQTIVIPAIALMLASGSLYIWEAKQFNKIFSRGILIFSLAVMFITGALQVREFYRVNHPEIVIAGELMDRIAAKDALVIAPYNGDTAFLYQTKRWGWPFVDRPIADLIDKGADFYVSVNFDDQTNELMKNYKVIEKNASFIVIDLQRSP